MSPEAFLIESMFYIPNKNGDKVKFKLNPHQVALDESLSGRDIIPKARQLGVSMYILARFAIECLTKDNRRCVIVSHQSEATRRLLSRIKYMLNNIDGLKPDLSTNTSNEITFRKTNSTLYIGTAGNADFAVGDTITNLHASECSRWKDAGQLLLGLFQAVPSTGQIFIESTGHGVGNWFHKACMRASEGQGFKMHFLPWNREPEYRKFLTPHEQMRFLSSLDEDLGEPELLRSGMLDVEQLAWRRDKIIEMDYSMQAMLEQYPLTLDECFQSDGASFFTRIKKGNHLKTMVKDPDDRHLFVLPGHPDPDLSYVIGADISGGVGRDNSVAEIICLETLEQVGEWCNNRTQPDTFTDVLIRLSNRFNGAMMNPERNNHGLVVVSGLDRAIKARTVPRERVYREKHEMGTMTTLSSKPRMIAMLRNALANDITIYSESLIAELQTFVEDDGKLAAQSGCFDDRVMSLSMAVHAISRAAMLNSLANKPKARLRDPMASLYAR